MTGDDATPGPLPHAVLVILIIAGLLPACSALHVDGIKILMDVRPGETYAFPMGVGIDPGDPATDIAVDVMGFGQSADGSYVQVPPSDDSSPSSGRAFITVDSPVISLSPGESHAFNATIRVPADVPAGGYYATIHVHPIIQPGGTGAGITTAVLVPAFLTVQGPGLTETASITGLRLTGDPTVAEVTLRNTGNHHFYGAKADVTVTDATGNTIATGSSRPAVWALIPGGEMPLKVPVSPALPQGSYTVKAEARIGEGGALLDAKTAMVTTGAPVAAVTATVQAPRAGGQAQAETTAGGGVPFLPASIPWPGALVTVAAAAGGAVLTLARSRR